MRLLTASFILPWLTCFTIGCPISGVICLMFQITIVGCLAGTVWAMFALSQFMTDCKIAAVLAERGRGSFR